MGETARRTYYDDLGLRPGAGQKEIEMSYWRRVTASSGRRDGNWEEAYFVLSDPARRKDYDRKIGLDRHPAWSGGESGERAERLWRRALGLLRENREREALRSLRSSLRLQPAGPGRRSLLALLVARAEGDPREGLRLALAAYRQAPRNTAVVENLAAVCELAGLRKRACGLRQSLRKASARRPATS